MKPIVIKIHSFIDVITNSSTEIFVSTHSKTVEMAKELIDEILKASGSDKKAEDLFEFKSQTRLQLRDEVEDWKKYESEMDDDEYKWIDEGEKYDDNVWTEYNWCDRETSRLVIVAKNDDKTTIDLSKRLEAIFYIDGTYNG